MNWCNQNMDKFEERRLALLNLVNGMGRGGRIQVANAIGKTPDYISRMLYPKDKPGKKGIGEESVELLDKSFPGWLKKMGEAQSPQANETPSTYGVPRWPFLSVTQEEWARIPFATRQLLEQQIKSLVPAAANRQAA
jgi:hypothetical protein